MAYLCRICGGCTILMLLAVSVAGGEEKGPMNNRVSDSQSAVTKNRNNPIVSTQSSITEMSTEDMKSFQEDVEKKAAAHMKQFMDKFKESSNVVSERKYKTRFEATVPDPKKRQLLVNWEIQRRLNEGVIDYERTYGLDPKKFAALCEVIKSEMKRNREEPRVITNGKLMLVDRERAYDHVAQERLMSDIRDHPEKYPVTEKWKQSVRIDVETGTSIWGDILANFEEAQQEYLDHPEKHAVAPDGCAWVKGDFTKLNTTPLCMVEGHPSASRLSMRE